MESICGRKGAILFGFGLNDVHTGLKRPLAIEARMRFTAARHTVVRDARRLASRTGELQLVGENPGLQRLVILMDKKVFVPISETLVTPPLNAIIVMMQHRRVAGEVGIVHAQFEFNPMFRACAPRKEPSRSEDDFSIKCLDVFHFVRVFSLGPSVTTLTCCSRSRTID
jgi:hypothetical protein